VLGDDGVLVMTVDMMHDGGSLLPEGVLKNSNAYRLYRLTSQINENNQLKAGINFNYDDIKLLGLSNERKINHEK
jgi:hypothetical protein